MRAVARAAVVTLAAGLVAFGGVAPAAADPSIPLVVDSPQVELHSVACTNGTFNPGIYFRTHVVGVMTSDNDGDVNVGTNISTSMWVRHPFNDPMPGTLVGFSIAGTTHEVGPVPLNFTNSWTESVVAPSYSVSEADAGTVIRFATTSLHPGGFNVDCSMSPDQGVVGLYVNRPPAPVDDEVSTAYATEIVIDVLENDDATWDSGVITSSDPTPDELATQDDLAEVPTADRFDAVAIASVPDNGIAALGPDAQISYTPNDGFAGEDSFTYSLTDNDGATSTATVHVEVSPPAAAHLSVTASATTVDQGGSVTLTAAGLGSDGFDLGEVTGDVVFTSDVATDVIDGNTVSFPTASPHTITATHVSTGVTATIVIQVTPAIINVYTVTFDSARGSPVTIATANEGDPVLAPADPTRAGYRFTGWYTGTDAATPYDFDTSVTGDVTLYAGWEKVTVEVPPAATPPGTDTLPTTGGSFGPWLPLTAALFLAAGAGSIALRRFTQEHTR